MHLAHGGKKSDNREAGGCRHQAQTSVDLRMRPENPPSLAGTVPRPSRSPQRRAVGEPQSALSGVRVTLASRVSTPGPCRSDRPLLGGDEVAAMAERFWLDVPYAEKQQAKDAGARWDGKARRWYAQTS